MKANSWLLTMTELSWIQLHHLQYDWRWKNYERIYTWIMEAQCWIYYLHCRHLQMWAHISCSQLNPSCMWFSWPSGESGSGGGFLVGSTASAKWASNDSRSVRLRGWCTVGLSMILLPDLTWGHVGFNSTQIVAHRHLSGDSDWFRLDFHSVYHLCTESFYLASLSTTTQHGCAGPVYFSHSSRVLLRIIWCLLRLRMPGRLPLL